MGIDWCAIERLVNVLRGIDGRMSDHYLVEVRVKICGGFLKRGNNLGEKRVMKVCELGKQTCFKRD